MKKVFAIFAALVLAASAANAQDWLNSFLNMATEKVGDIVSGKGSATTFDIKGTWTYQGVAVAAGTGNVLGNLASAAGSSTIEGQADKLLAKAGIKAGAATFTFKEDGSFTLNAGKINLPGTWTKEGSKITLNFAKLFNFKLVGTIKTNATGCELLFESGKFLDFTKKVLDVVGKLASNNTAVSAVQSAITNVKDLQLGFKLSK